jgi:ribosomal protein S18 acetylase RimI-like enzyme
MNDMPEIYRIQNYLRNAARHQYDWVELDAFSLFFHPSDALKYFNYAIPNRPCGDEVSALLPTLRAEFNKHQRTARFEFFEAFAPQLPAVLRAHGFEEEGRQWSMICTAQTWQEIPPAAGITLSLLSPQSSWADARDFMQVQQEAFSPGETSTPSEDEIAQALLSFARRSAFLARVEGEPAGAGSFSQPLEGVTELTGVATRMVFRRQGIATALTSLAVSQALQKGVKTVCLTAEDERAGRVYQRAGFLPFSTMLAYIDQA